MIQEQKALDDLEKTKKHLTQQVSAEELYDLMRTEPTEIGQIAKLTELRNAAFVQAAIAAPIQDTFRKNKLSVDPVVLPTSRLENIAQVQMKTIEKEMTVQYQSIRSPRKSVKGSAHKSPGKFVFAPQNGVYNQTQLLQNPELAK